MVDLIGIAYELKDPVLLSLAGGLAISGLMYSSMRKDAKFREAILSGFLGEFPKDKVLRINYSSGDFEDIFADEVNERIRRQS